MANLNNLNDKQNLLLTQLSYKSDVLKDNYNGMTLKEIISVVPDNQTKKTLQDLCDAGAGSLRIKDVGNDPVSGFGAIAFTDDSGNTGFSFRGSDGLSMKSINDWVDNFTTMATGTSVQSEQAEKFFDINKDPNGNNYLYGHSKGGELSEYVFVNNYNSVKKAHLLNPQPLNPYSLTVDQRAAINSDKMDMVIVEGDYVWFLGKLPSYKNIRIAKSNGGNSHLYSSICDMYDENGNIIEGKMPWWEYPAYFAITIATKKLQIIGGAFGFVYNCAKRVINFVKDDLIPAAREFIAAVADAIAKIESKLKEYADKLKEFLGSVIDKTKNWLREHFDRGYKEANSNPQVTLDTYKLSLYAERLQSINKRITVLDSRMDSLYTQVGLLDLWNLLQADILTGYSLRLLRCIGYLNKTADDFNSTESSIINAL